MRKLIFFLLFIPILVLAQPINLQENNLTSTSVDLSWVDASCGNPFQLRYRLSSSASWNAPFTVFVGTDTSLVGLTSGTSYDWKVKCSGGAWSPTESFTTLNAGVIPTISTAFISQPILCNGDYSSDEIHIDISQTSPPSSYACVVGYYPFPGYFIKYIGTIQTTAIGLDFISFNPNVDYFVRLVDSAVYFSANPFGNGFSTDGIFDEFGPITFTEPAELLATTTTVSANMCFDDCIAAEELNISGGIEPYSFTFDGGTPINLSTGTNNYTFTNLCSGQFQIIITDANGCIQNLSLIIDAPDTLSTTYVATDPTCYGGSDGSAEFSIIGGSANYTINAFGNSFVTPLPVFSIPTGVYAGIYPFSITDENGCFYTDIITINEPATITSIDTQLACDSYNWIDNVNYTSSNNTATYTLVSSSGCDSIITLNLTIYNSTTTNINITNCESYLWYGQLITQSGTYTTTLNTLNGCDSILFLDATIINCGCTDPIAFNYDSTAILDDGSCIAILSGCTDTLACNYDVLVNSDDGSCTFPVTVLNEINSCDSVLYNGVYYSQSFSDTIVFYGTNGFVVDTSNSMSYCASNPLPELNNSNTTTIDEVTLVGDNFSINNNTSGYDDFYDDFTYWFADISENQTYTINVTVGDLSGGNYNGGAKVFIDYNIDGDFLDAGEEIGIIPVQSVSGTSVALSFTVPNTGIYGSTRIRVVCWSTYDFTTSGTANDIIPCESPALNSMLHPWFGATEDYSVVLLPPNTYSSLCDSIAVLNLTINQADTSYTNITACDSLVSNGNTYTQSGTYISNISSNNNYSISFDGNDANSNDEYIEVANGENIFNINHQHSISAWVYPLTPLINSAGNSNWHVIFDGSASESSNGSNNAGFDLMITDQNKLYAFVGLGVNQTSSNLYSNSSVPLNQWSYVTVTRNNDSLKLYINGVLDNFRSDLPSINISYNGSSYETDIYQIGRYTRGGNALPTYLHGDISDVELWNTALSQQEIQQYMNCPPTGNESGLVGYWNFEEGTGTTAYDQTSNGNDGIINGATYDTNVPSQSCNLTNVNGCDSTVIINLIIGISGCTDSTATNYDTNADCDDGSCIPYTYGCTDPIALNFEPLANTDDGSCTYCNNDTSYTDMSSCGSVVWNGNTYDSSGTYSYLGVQQTPFSGFSFSSSLGNSDYYVSNNSASWIEADSICTALGGHLVVISDINENNFVNNLTNYPIWIGLRQNTNNINFSEPTGGWEWENNEIFNYSNWGPTEPNNQGGNENYADMEVNGYWNDIYNSYQIKYIMEIPSSLQTVNGCDSVAVLNLTINQGDTSYTDITACDSVVWNGTTYTQSGIYSYNGGGTPSNISGFIYAGNYNGSDYYISDATDSWTNANTICNNNNAHLVTIADSNEYNLIKTIVDSFQVGVWIGLYQDTSSINYSEPNGGWQWVTGENLTFINWASSEPNNSNNNPEICETYVEMNSVTHLWYDQWNTTNSFHYILEVPSQLVNINGCDSTAILDLTINQADTSYTNITSCDSVVWNGIIYDSSGTYVYSSVSTGNVATISGYDYIGSLANSNYYLSQTYSTWTDANQQCILFGGHLATISSQSENDTIYNGITASANTNNNQAWIGLYQNANSSSYSEPSGGWEWSSGDVLSYTNWNPNTLLNSGSYGAEDHAEITNGGYWNDMNNNEYSNLNPSGLRHVLEVGTNQLTTINGCDSTAVLNLTINYTDTSYTNITACDSLVWNGTTYTQSGTYSYSGSASNNYSMSFDGNDDWVSINHNQNYCNNNSSFTIGFYIKSTDSGPNQMAVNSYGDAPINNNITYYLPENSFMVRGSIEYNTPSTSIANDGSWHHIAITRDINTNLINVYFDGQLESSAIKNVGSCQNTNPLYLMRSGYFGQYVSGNIDEFMIWNTALSQLDIQQYMQCSPNGNESGLVGYWNFEEGSGTTAFDLTSNGNDGIINGATYDTNVPSQSCNLTNANSCDSTAILNLTINQGDTSYTYITACDSLVWNGTTYTQSGTYYNENTNNTSCLDFGTNCNVSGNSWVDCGDVLDMTGSFSVGGWIYNNGCDYTTIVSKREGNLPYNGFHLSYENQGNFEFIIQNNVNSGGEIIGVSAISNQWVHVVGVFDAGNSISIYIDGQLANSQSTSVTSLSNNNAPFLIGSLQTPGSWSWDGKLDDIFIYDSALSPSDISNIYTHCNMPENSLQGFWNFEQGGGTTAYDQTSNGNDGAINGATYDVNTPFQSCTLMNANGCDSTEVLNLTIYLNTTIVDSLKICEGDSVLVGTNIYTSVGNYIDTLSTTNGCDSIINTIIDIIDIDIVQNDTTICLGDSIVLGVDGFTSPWQLYYLEDFESNINTSNEWSPSTNSLINIPSRSTSFGNFSNGSKFLDLTNLPNHDSLKIFFNFYTIDTWDGNSTSNGPDLFSLSCDGNILLNSTFSNIGTHLPNNWNYSLSQSYPSNYGLGATFAAGYPLFQFLSLPSFSGGGTIEYDIERTTEHSNSTLLVEFKAQGLQSINDESWALDNVQVYLYSNNPITNTIWSTGDTTASIIVAPSQTTTYWVTQTTNGVSCTDSVTVTVNQPTYSTTSITECDSVVWNGQVYTNSIIDSVVFTNAMGCDSIAILDLTINQTDTSYTNITACDSLVWNGTTYDSSGVYSYSGSLGSNYSLSFDNSNVEISPSIFQGISKFTFSAYFNADLIQDGFSNIVQYDPGGVASGFYIRYESNLSQFVYSFDLGNSYYNLTLPAIPSLNNWHHVAMTYDSDTVRAYLDGIEVGSGEVSGSFINWQGSTLYIGNWMLQEDFNGYIDDVQIWDEALSLFEIGQYMNCPPTGNETGLVGYWNFEQGSGTTALDQTSNGNNGTINGATYDTNVPSQSCNLINANGCDSTAVLNLTINSSVFITDSITICDGANVSVGTSIYDTSGSYIDTLQTANSCDSIINTVIDVIDINIVQNDTTICYGDSISLSLSNISQSNSISWSEIYLEDFEDGQAQGWYAVNGAVGGQGVTNIGGVHVWRQYSDWNHFRYPIPGYPSSTGLALEIKAMGLNYSSNFGFRSNVSSWNICSQDAYQVDVTLQELYINPNIVTSFNAPMNNWHTYRIEDVGNDYNFYIDGVLIHQDINLDKSGFGNMININSGGPSYNTSQKLYVDYVKVENANLTSTLIASDYLWSTGDTSTSITVSPNQTTTYWVTQTQNGVSCTDSVTITVNQPTYSNVNITDCNSYVLNGVTYIQSGTFVSSTTNSVGCDSLITLNLIINFPDSSVTNITACDSFFWNDSTYFSSGVYTFDTLTSNGCDSTATINLTINSATTSTDTIISCDTFTWVDGVTYTASNNTATYMFQTVDGCDSLSTLYLTINYSDTSYTNITACDSVLWNGTTYDSSGTYSYTIPGDTLSSTSSSVVNFTVFPDNGGTVINTVAIPANATSITLDIRAGGDLNSSSEYFNIYFNNVQYGGNWSSGFQDCTLHDIALNQSVGGLITGSALSIAITSSSAVDDLNNCNPTSSMIAELTFNFTGQSILYCDSTEILNLTINYSDASTDTQVHCDSYTWVDGITYTSTNNTATYMFQTVDGCDSLSTLDLTINNSYASTDSQVHCEAYTWVDGFSYTTSNNTATYMFQTVDGCDSLSTLDLTINYSDSSIDTQVDCDTYTWVDGVTYTASNNTALYMFQTVDGCDSLSTLDLTINYSDTSYATVMACDSFIWNGITYTTSGTYDTTFASTSEVNTFTYCASNPNSNFASQPATIIEHVELTGDNSTQIDNNTSGVSDFYEDYSPTMYADIQENQSYTINVTVGDLSGGSYNGGAKVFIDYNIDGDFLDAGEDIGIIPVQAVPGTSVPLSFTVPTTGAYGPTRMRVVCQSTYDFTTPNDITACESPAAGTWANPWFGATEDYSIVLFNPTSTTNLCDSTALLNLTILNSSSVTSSVTSCNTFDWNGQAITVSGSYSQIFTNLSGCDSVHILVVTINYSNTGTSSITSCNTYDWNGQTITVSGSYDQTFTNASGCDSVHTLVATITYSNTGTSNITACNTYDWNGQTISTSGSYDQTFINAVGCDSVHTLIATINYSNTGTSAVTSCNTYDWNGQIITVSGSYDQTFTNASGCDSVHTLVATFTYSNTGTSNITACNTYNWNGQTISTSGIYAQNFTNASGCDSVHTLVATISYSNTGTSSIVACNTYDWNGQTIIVSGSYNQTFTNAVGCDSVHTLIATINYSNTGTSAVTSCNTYDWNGQIITVSGSYDQTFTNASGCDSVHTLVATFTYSNTGTSNITACNTYNWNGQTISTSGSYAQNFTNASGCDSVHTLAATITYSNTGTSNITACNTYNWNGQTISTSGIYDQTFINVAGCDSVHTLAANITTSNTGTSNITSCDTYNWNGQTITSSGSYDQNFSNASGCDSVHTLVISMSYTDTSYLNVNSCDSFYWYGTTYYNSGTYTYVLNNSQSSGTISTLSYCASNPNSNFASQPATIIEHVELTGDNSTQIDNNTSGVSDFYEDYSPTMYADIQENQSYTINVTVGDLSGGSYNGGAKVFIDYNIDGDFLDAGEDIGIIPVQAVPGTSVPLSFTVPTTGAYGPTRMRVVCQSTYDFTTPNNITACESPAAGSWANPWFGATEDYSIVLSNPSDSSAFSCDSVLIMSLNIYNSSYGTTSVTECDNYDWNGQTISTSGSYDQTFTNASGCDSVHTLVATINYSNIGTSSITSCNTYDWNGQTITASGSYDQTFTNASGCDSVHTLVATINYSNTGTSSIVACNTYDWNGQTIIVSGSYNQTFTNASGCDSVHTLITTINYPNTGISTITACNSYIWNGQNIATSGNYNQIFANVSGCDSVHTLVAIINYTNTGTTSVTACDSYTWNSQTITTSGTYNQIFTNVAGCDSIHNLVTTINYSNTGVSYVTACDTFNWNGQTITTSGSYDQTFTNVSSCDSTHTLVVTVNYSNSGYSFVTECDKFVWYNDTIFTSGIYTKIFFNASGCDSIHTLDVTINYADFDSTFITACDTFTWNSQLITQSGYYQQSFTNVLGCDSVHLLIATLGFYDSTYSVISACDSYIWNGQNIIVTGVYSQIFTNIGGCDSVHTLMATINSSINGSSSVTSCDTYNWNGQLISLTGTYSQSFTNANGCDSIHTLLLTINYSSSGTSTITTCDTYNWNGQQITSSGIYNQTFSNINGCDSLHTLVATINQSISGVSLITVCDSFVWNGLVYLASGTYSQMFTNTNGCDSLVTLYLTVNKSNNGQSSLTACDSYIWNGQLIYSSGSYNQTFTNMSGCDSLHSLIVTILPGNVDTVNFEICSGDSVTILNNVYYQSGTFYDTISSQNGCDSVVISNINVNNIITSQISGPSFGVEFEIDSFVVFNNLGSSYNWGVNLGVILQGQGTNQIEIEWTTDGLATVWVIETDINGCISDTAFLALEINRVSGINDLIIKDLLIYPNPTQGLITISFNSTRKNDYKIRVIGMLGESVFEDELTKFSGDYKHEVDLSKYSKAIYFLEIESDQGVISKKITLQ